MTQPRWSTTAHIDAAHFTQVFCGGACNIRDENGVLLRNPGRDGINDWLTNQGVTFYDPQIHPDTHGEQYDYAKHAKLEFAARTAARINLYEVSPRTFGGITSFEIAADHFQYHEPTIIYFSDLEFDSDTLPPHSKEGHPLFVPAGIHDNATAMTAHYEELIKNATAMRKYIFDFARRIHALTISLGEKTFEGDIIISPDRIHAADLFEAVVQAASGQRVMVNFTGDVKARDEQGGPIFLAPKSPPEMEIRALLDQYVDEGNDLRRRIAELVKVSVFVRVVYTEKAAITALEELLRVKKIIQ